MFCPSNSHSPTAKSMLLGAHRQYSTHSPTETKSQKMLYYLTAVVFGMVGLTYAAVPLYRTFCQATGYGGTVQRKEVYCFCLFLSFFSPLRFQFSIVSLSQSFCLDLCYRLLRRRLLGIQNLVLSLKGVYILLSLNIIHIPSSSFMYEPFISYNLLFM